MEPQTNNQPEPTEDVPTTAESAETAAPEAAPDTTAAPAAEPVRSDIADNKTLAVLGYIVPILFFLPLLDDKAKNVLYVRFHANQQLILLIILFGAVFLHSTLFMLLLSLGYLLSQLINLAVFVLAVIGAIGAYKGEMKELPYVGHFRILK